MDSRRKYNNFYVSFGGIKIMAKSDCVFAGEENSDGLVWCEKKNIYVTAKERDTCEFYQPK